MSFLTRATSNKRLMIALIVVGAVLFLGTAGAFAMVFGYDRLYTNRIFPGVTVWGISLGGVTQEQAQKTLTDHVDRALADGWHFRSGDQDVVVHPLEEKSTLITYDITNAVALAMKEGRQSSRLRNMLAQFRLRTIGKSLDVPVQLDRPAVEKTLRDHLKGQLQDPKNAELYVSVPSGHATATITIIPEKIGRLIDMDPAMRALEQQAKTLNFEVIALNETRIIPERTAENIQRLTDAVPVWLSHAPFTVTAFDRSWVITSSTLGSWLNVTTSTGDLDLDPERVQANLLALVKNLVSEPKDGTLVMTDGKIKEFVAPQTGIVLDAAASIQSIKEGWSHGSTTMPLVLREVTPALAGPDAEHLGIREILGIGRSNFSGSPSNRRQNIAHGARLVNGVLLAPDEEFSMLKTLGPVDGAHGWLQELVIKGDKTVPEYGGGLCQIGTTTFRTALASGMPITERQNHSYRVRYYEPAGTDATIYDPAPDFKFKNDTGHWILITTQVKGDELLFTMWGTKDGRAVVQSTPRVYNIVPPPPKKIIETLELPVGKTKCTETAHAGADASFDYTVTNAGGQVSKTTFRSHYKPWGAVCLLGVAQLSSASGTSSGVDETGVNNPI